MVGNVLWLVFITEFWLRNLSNDYTIISQWLSVLNQALILLKACLLPPPTHTHTHTTVHLFCFSCLWNANTHFGYHGTEKSAWSSTLVLFSPLHHPNHINHCKAYDSDSERDSNPRPGIAKWPAMLWSLSYRVTQQLSGWVRVLKAELPGIQLKQIPSWHAWWGGCGEREARGTGPDFRHAPDLTVRP